MEIQMSEDQRTVAERSINLKEFNDILGDLLLRFAGNIVVQQGAPFIHQSLLRYRNAPPNGMVIQIRIGFPEDIPLG